MLFGGFLSVYYCVDVFIRNQAAVLKELLEFVSGKLSLHLAFFGDLSAAFIFQTYGLLVEAVAGAFAVAAAA